VRRFAALLAVVLVAACSGDDDAAPPDTTTRRQTTTTVPPTTTTTSEQELAGFPVEVVEQGFSVFPDPVDPDATLGGFGVVVRNPNPHVLASGVTVTARLVDAAGTVLASDTTLLNGVQPRARMAVGRTLIEPIEDPARLEVEVDVSAWLEPVQRRRAMVARQVRTQPTDGGGLLTTFQVRSRWPRDEEGVDVAAVFRAADGRILGAEMTTLEKVPAGGTTRGEIPLLAPLPDLHRTDVLVGRGFAAHTSG
jgi:hypothetical protein